MSSRMLRTLAFVALTCVVLAASCGAMGASMYDGIAIPGMSQRK